MEKKSKKRRRRVADFSRNDTAIAKLAAIFLMMFHHLFLTEARFPEGSFVVQFGTYKGGSLLIHMGAFGKVCVAMFLFLSGYGTYMQLRKKKNISAAVALKLKGLYLSFWKVFLIFIPIAMMLGVERVNPEAADPVTYSLSNFVLNFLGIAKHSHSFNSEWWFFICFVFLTMLVPLILRWLKRRHSNFFTDFLVVIVISLLYRSVFFQILDQFVFKGVDAPLTISILDDVVRCLPTFLMGCLFARYQVFGFIRKKIYGRHTDWFWSLVVIFVTFVIHREWGADYEFILIGPFVLSVVILLKKIPGIPWAAARMSPYITYMWLIHSFFCYQFCPGFIYSFRYPALILLVLFVITFAASFAVFWLYRILGIVVASFRKPTLSGSGS